MTVLSMCLTEFSYYLLMALAIIFAYLGKFGVVYSYLAATMIFISLYLVIVRIPLNLNWSSNLYNSILRRSFSYPALSVFIYSLILYFNSGVMGYKNALLASASAWLTLDISKYSVPDYLIPITIIASFTATITFAVITAVIWLYVEKRLWKKSLDEKGTNPETLKMQVDSSLGGLHELDNVRTREEQRTRDSLRLVDCKCGNKKLKIDKFFDILGRTFPIPKFVIHCTKCGRFTKPTVNAYMAAFYWNLYNRENIWVRYRSIPLLGGRIGRKNDK